MLTELNIRNFAIIDELTVTFDGGVNILSGETGAGKSIIIGAVGLLLGERASAEMIRSPADEAVVEARFAIGDQGGLPDLLREMGFDAGEDLVVRRVVSRSGRNRVYINGGLASLSSLAALGESLINVCGQHEHQKILKAENHLGVLDEFGALTPLREAYRETFGRYRVLKERQAELEALCRQRAEREDLLRFQVDEIARAAIAPQEDVTLADEKRVLGHVQKLIDAAEGGYEILYGKGDSVLAQLRQAAAAVREIRKIDPGLTLTEEEINDLYYRSEEAALTLRDYGQRLCFDPARLEAIDERLELLGRLKRKYGGSLEAVLGRQADGERELGRIASLEGEAARLAEAIAAERGQLAAAADALSRRRRSAALTLKGAVEAEIRTLQMENARFEVSFRELSPEEEREPYREAGVDDGEFYFSANPGEEMKPLRAIASGGELSRIMLSLKKVLARTGSVGTIVFDEVDSGIGGATAEIVGQKLKEVARHHQVICITHLPQIACFGDRHYQVVKRVVGERATTAVALLDPEARLEEIARMLGGVELTEKTREHAREMLFFANASAR
jgi:DNA repair protein RecN (Recombination protein N)